MNDEPAMSIHCEFYITNIMHFGVKICCVKINKPKVFGHIMIHEPEGNIWGGYIIPEGCTREAPINFLIKNPICKENDNIALDIYFIDQLGNEHRIRKVEFKYLPPKEKKLINIFNREGWPYFMERITIRPLRFGVW